MAGLSGPPLPIARELRACMADGYADRHWAGPAGCWCDLVHAEAEEGVTLVMPPWERAAWAGVAS